ncbi:MAG: hypothetical protein EBY26_00620, partial [Microbacteriaceae bacterium]|nr:hypothetical protein [Microbacteriaceae bacterium]
MDSQKHPWALSRLVTLVSDGYPVAKLQSKLKNRRIELLSPSSAHPTLVALLDQLREQKGLGRVQLVVVATGREAEDAALALKALMPNLELLEFPSWETLPHERLSPSPETVGKRLKVLHRLHDIAGDTASVEHPVVVLASVRAVLQPVVAGLGDHPPLKLAVGGDYLLPELNLKLVEMAYVRVDMVTKRGEFAARGGIVDIFPTTAEHAVRLEFFGDELEEIREFSVADQRSLTLESGQGAMASVEIYPAREIIITPSVASRAREMQHEFPNLSTMLAKIAEGMPVEGMESLAP